MIRVVHIRKFKSSEYVGRPSPLGNPYKLHVGESRGSTLERYEKWLRGKIISRDPVVINELKRLREIHKIRGELYLGCYCSPEACHGDIIKKYLERPLYILKRKTIK